MNRLWVRLSGAYCLIFVVVFVVLVIGLAEDGSKEEGVSEKHISLLVEAGFSPKEIAAFIVLAKSGGLEKFIMAREVKGLRNLVMVVLTAGLLSGILVSYWFTRPLNTLSKAAQSIGERDLSKRVHLTGGREFLALGLSFNEMAEALQEAETHRKNLLADVAHELRTPLTVLQNNLRAILDDVYDLGKEQIFTLYSQTRQLSHLVDDLHALAQADAHQLPLHTSDIDMIGLIEQAGELFEPLAQEEGISLRLSTPDDMPVLRGDRARVIQVVQNLLTNAMRHANSQVDVRLWHNGNTACVDVVNDGGGIAAAHLPRVFDRFYRIDKSRSRESGGSGLGLAIAKAIVNAHNGIITVVSDGLEQGTTIRFELPIA